MTIPGHGERHRPRPGETSVLSLWSSNHSSATTGPNLSLFTVTRCPARNGDPKESPVATLVQEGTSDLPRDSKLLRGVRTLPSWWFRNFPFPVLLNTHFGFTRLERPDWSCG